MNAEILRASPIIVSGCAIAAYFIVVAIAHMFKTRKRKWGENYEDV